MSATRPAAVAGRFYPDDPARLQRVVRSHLEQGDAEGELPKALIAPHAGFIYSGDTAGHAFAPLARGAQNIDRVVLIGPSHHVGFTGMAISSADAFETPLGQVPVDQAARHTLVDKGLVAILDEPHEKEHSLETHLPFLQEVLDDFQVVPIVVGRAGGEDVAELLEELWGGEETVVSISSDLSHFHTYEQARQIDRRTCEAIEQMQPAAIDREQACGRIGIQGLLIAATRHDLGVETLDLRNSGDTAGSRDRVVGYGAWAFG